MQFVAEDRMLSSAITLQATLFHRRTLLFKNKNILKHTHSIDDRYWTT